VVLLEAMAAGTPVVASKIAGYQNVATHDVDALLVEPSDERGLASALAKVMTNSRLSARLIEAGHIRVDESSMRNLAEKYVAVYRRALEMEQNGQGDGYAHRQPSGASQGRWRPSRMLALFEHRLLRK
jgi:glycogen synthase